jgi:hypothetical protein
MAETGNRTLTLTESVNSLIREKPVFSKPRYFTIISLWLFLFNCSSTLPRLADTLGTKIEPHNSNEYRITNITLNTLENDSVKVFCRVQKEGKRVRGFLEAVIISSAGETVFRDTVLSYKDTRVRSYTQSDLGFPFSFTVPVTILRNSTMRLAFIEDAISINKIFKRQ